MSRHDRIRFIRARSVSVGGGAGVSDTTAPVLSAIDTSGVPDALDVTTTEVGTMYWMVDSNASRTAPQVKTGGGEASGSYAVEAGSNTDAIDLSAVADGTWYLHLMQEDAAENQSNVSSTEITLASAIYFDSFTTDTSADYTAFNSVTIAWDSGDEDLDVTQTGAWSGIKLQAQTVTSGVELSFEVNLYFTAGSSTGVNYRVGTTDGGTDIFLSTPATAIDGEKTLTGTFTPGVTTIYIGILINGGGDGAMNIHDMTLAET